MKRKGIKRRKKQNIGTAIGAMNFIIGFIGFLLMGCAVDGYENLNEWFIYTFIFLLFMLLGAFLLKVNE